VIRITRLNGSELLVNAEMIEFVEASPDTIISLLSGKKIIVGESIETVVARVIAYKRDCNTPLVSGTQG
jgi:flagellar protein FlbD